LATITRDPVPELRPLSPGLFFTSGRNAIATADVDSDGHDDLVVSSGTGELTVVGVDEHGPKELGTVLTTRGQGDPGGYGNALSVGDFTGDGLLDLAVRDAVDQQVILLRQSTDHPGTLDAAEVTLPSYYRSGFADLDGDRRDDLITYGGTAGNLFYANPGDP